MNLRLAGAVVACAMALAGCNGMGVPTVSVQHPYDSATGAKDSSVPRIGGADGHAVPRAAPDSPTMTTTELAVRNQSVIMKMRERAYPAYSTTPACIIDNSSGNPDPTNIFLDCPMTYHHALRATFSNAVTDGLYGVGYSCGSLKFRPISQSGSLPGSSKTGTLTVAISGGTAGPSPCGPGERDDLMNLQMDASESQAVPEWQIALGSIYYDGLDCYPYPLCTPNSQTSWHAENPASNLDNDPFGYILSAFVFDGPCVNYAQFFVNSGHKHNILPIVLAAEAAHESGYINDLQGDASKMQDCPPGDPDPANNCAGRGLMMIDIGKYGDPRFHNWPNWADPASNIEAGADILAKAIALCPTFDTALITYNAGPDRFTGRCNKDLGNASRCQYSDGSYHTYIECFYYHLTALEALGYNADCASAPMAPPTLPSVGINAESANEGQREKS